METENKEKYLESLGFSNYVISLETPSHATSVDGIKFVLEVREGAGSSLVQNLEQKRQILTKKRSNLLIFQNILVKVTETLRDVVEQLVGVGKLHDGLVDDETDELVLIVQFKLERHVVVFEL